MLLKTKMVHFKVLILSRLFIYCSNLYIPFITKHNLLAIMFC